MTNASPANNPRRIVTGLDAEGRATILIDDSRPLLTGGVQLVWRSIGALADNSGTADAAAIDNVDMVGLKEGSNFALVSFAPGGDEAPFMHATDTLDYAILLRGRLEFLVETGSVELAPGDIVVDRGVVHGWRALGDEPALLAVIVLPAHPVGAGATI